MQKIKATRVIQEISLQDQAQELRWLIRSALRDTPIRDDIIERINDLENHAIWLQSIAFKEQMS